MGNTSRRKVIAGNWKMNQTPSEAKQLIEELKEVAKNKNSCDIVICVPFVDISVAVSSVQGTNIKVGAQNVHFAKSGAYTGEISADMLKECGVEYVIIGHSERRQYFNETDETVKLRTKAALDASLKVILCVGESEEEREKNITNEILSIQTKIALQGIDFCQLKNIIFAYEPIWAIGTGKTATTQQADEACGIIRKTIEELYNKEQADNVIIQYGGSMNAQNAKELLSCENVDGGLIGGASLKSSDFGIIIDAAQ